MRSNPHTHTLRSIGMNLMRIRETFSVTIRDSH